MRAAVVILRIVVVVVAVVTVARVPSHAGAHTPIRPFVGVVAHISKGCFVLLVIV